MKFVRLSLCVLSATVLLSSCLKKTYDSPLDSSQYDPNLTVHTSLKQISNMALAMGSGHSRVMGDTTVYGVVVADDKSGNFYKQIVIEDTSFGGVVLYMDKSYIYNDYPAGRKIYVKLKGLTLANYNGLPEIVYTADQANNTVPIPSGLLGNYIVKGNYPNTTVQAREVTIDQVKSNPYAYLNTLVKMSGVQFTTVNAGVAYALPSSSANATNRLIESCDHSVTATLRTSGYCNFQPYTTPTGNGTATVIVSMYSSLQLFIRDTTDVNMTNTRCLP